MLAGSFAGEDRALNGQYAPGTAFKMVSALAMLQNGIGLNDKIGCPQAVTIDGKRFENYDDIGGPGQISMSTNFARSCNTAFISQAPKLDNDSLTKQAQQEYERDLVKGAKEVLLFFPLRGNAVDDLSGQLEKIYYEEYAKSQIVDSDAYDAIPGRAWQEADSAMKCGM